MSEPIENSLLYRFRSVDGLLGDKYQELKRQSIFFAPPHLLNDPAEGFRHIHFEGDGVLWWNIFKHYLACLVNTCYDYLLFGENKSIEQLIHTLSPEDIIPDGIKGVWGEIKSSFLENESVKSLIDNIVKVRPRVSQVEFLYYISMVHPFGLKCIFEHFNKIGLVGSDLQSFEKAQFPMCLEEGFFKAISALDEEKRERALDFLLHEFHMHSQQMPLIFERGRKLEPNKRFLIAAFPYAYTKKLENLMYPNWFTSCFMTRPNNSSVWGNYGNNHSGVCLIFGLERNEDGRYTLPLDNARVGYGSNGPIMGRVQLPFHEIRYTHLQESLNFFTSIGQLPIPLINKFWLTNNEGRMSDFNFDFSDQWREKYWADFYSAITQKSKEWEYENEHRLIISNMGGGYPETGVTLNYDFKSLKGIIFGINTKYDDKVKIIEVIEQKVRVNEHYDFKFYQAYYCRHSGEIKHTELIMLKFNRQAQ